MFFDTNVVPRQPFLPDASMDFAGLTPSLTVDSALHGRDNLYLMRQPFLPHDNYFCPLVVLFSEYAPCDTSSDCRFCAALVR